MDRRVKYTHITARTAKFLKEITRTTLKECCDGTISWAYNRLSQGHGLLTSYDRETLELLVQVINEVRKLGSPVNLWMEDMWELGNLRLELRSQLEEYREYLHNGSAPKYVVSLFRKWAQFAGYVEMSRDKDCLEARKELKADLHPIINKINSYLADFTKDHDLKDFRITYDVVYQIRAGYDNKKSNSDLIRGHLDGILDVPVITTEADRKILSDDLKVIREFQEWRRKAKKDADDHRKNGYLPREYYLAYQAKSHDKVLKTLEAIKIPKYKKKSKSKKPKLTQSCISETDIHCESGLSEP